MEPFKQIADKGQLYFFSCSWPPSEAEIILRKTTIPELTARLLQMVLTKRSKSSKVTRLVSSIGQYLIYHINNGKKKTSKHVAFPFCIKRKTGSKAVINWASKFGRGLSYDDVLILETHLAMEYAKDQEFKSFTPALIQPSQFVTFVWDNNDINHESLKGFSLHCINGIIIQSSRLVLNKPEPTSVPTSSQAARKVKPKTFKPMPVEIPAYVQIKRNNTENQSHIQRNLYEEVERRSFAIDTLWVIAKCQASIANVEQKIPNWTGFNYLLCNEISDDYHKIGYLPAINQSPSHHDTVLELLYQSKIKAEKLGLTETDVVLDMTIYSKAVEIILNPRYIDLKKFIVLRLGAFHTTCIFIAVIGKRFGDAGLRDIVIESNILGESSVEQILKGKHYNNAVRILKYFYDAMKRRFLESFEQAVLEHSDTLDISYQALINSAEFKDFLSLPTNETMKELCAKHKEVIDEIQLHEKSLLDGNLGPTVSVWASFLKMVQILFDFLRSVKLGDWKLHLQSTERMLRWMFAYDRPNYARFLTLYWVNMQKMPQTHPEVHNQFELGNYSVRRHHGKFNEIPSDQTIEQTINRQQKCGREINGFSISEGTVQRWVLTNHVAAKCQGKMEQFLGISEANSVTKDLARKRIIFDEECVVRS